MSGATSPGVLVLFVLLLLVSGLFQADSLATGNVLATFTLSERFGVAHPEQPVELERPHILRVQGNGGFTTLFLPYRRGERPTELEIEGREATIRFSGQAGTRHLHLLGEWELPPSFAVVSPGHYAYDFAGGYAVRRT